MYNFFITVSFALCIYVLVYRIDKIQELQTKTSDLLIEVVEKLEKHNIE